MRTYAVVGTRIARPPMRTHAVGAGVLDGPAERIVPLSRCVADAAPYDAGQERM